MRILVEREVLDEYLYGRTDWKSAEQTVKAFTWAHIYKLCVGELKNYQGDLFHDALFIDKTLDLSDKAEQSYIWSYDGWGTCINEEFWASTTYVASRPNAYSVTVYRKGDDDDTNYSYHIRIQRVTLGED